MKLAAIQAIFWQALHGESVDPSFIAGPNRLKVYANMFLFRQVDALRTDFPDTAKQLGDSAFLEAARGYLREHPSEHPDLGRLGYRFAAFLKEKDGAPPGVGDLAALEWARSEVFVEAEAEPIGPEEFARSLEVRLVPALRLVGRTAVWRRGFEVQEAELSPEEARALERALEGASFEEICAAFGDPTSAFEALQTWIGEGWLSAPRPAA
jgi:hypothetical protein